MKDLPLGGSVARPSGLRISDELLQAAARIRVGLTPEERVIGFTGITSEDGAGVLAMGIARALSRIEKDLVLLIKGPPGPAGSSGRGEPANRPGLLEAVAGDVGVEDAIQATNVPGLVQMSLGNRSQEALALLSSQRAGDVFGALRQRFRYVCMDMGTLLVSPSAIFLARLSDGVVLALRAGHRRREEVEQIQREMEATDLKLLGIVLTSRK